MAWEGGALVISAPDLPDELAVVPASALGLIGDPVPTAGSWRRHAGTALFTPRFAGIPRGGFSVVARHGHAWRELARLMPDSETETEPGTTVATIDPRVDSVPANLLRFSVAFSAEMSEGSAAGRIHLLDGAGSELPGSLLEMPPELWDRDRRRLTVLLEPGRIKRGLQSNVQAGPPLVEGGVVTLVVGSGVLDATGAPLAREARRTYRVGPAVRSRIEPGEWDVSWPSEPRGPLVVRFDRPLDRVLVRRYLRVTDASGVVLAGRVEIDEQVTQWMFTPAARSSPTRLHIDARLEDLAGNSVRRVFDRDLQSPADDSLEADEVVLRDPRLA